MSAMEHSEMKPLDRLLSAQEVAEYLNVPISTLYSWRYHGNGPPGLRVGKHLRYRRADIQAWVQDQIKDGRGRH
jgi:excisionase family DNA binding protein